MAEHGAPSCSCSLPQARSSPDKFPQRPWLGSSIHPPRARVTTSCLSAAQEDQRSAVGWVDEERPGKEEAAMIRVMSHPAVHPAPAPMEAPPPAPAPDAAPAPDPAAPAPAPAAAPAPAQGQGPNAVNAPPPGVLMRGPNPGWRLGLRLVQALLPAAALAAMASARDFASVTPFRYLVSAAALQCLWCLALAILNVYALLVGRSFRSPRAVAIRCVGDWITAALIFSAACASASITVFLDYDMMACYENHCPRFMAATAMAFLSWFAVAPFCLVGLGMVVHKLQRP